MAGFAIGRDAGVFAISGLGRMDHAKNDRRFKWMSGLLVVSAVAAIASSGHAQCQYEAAAIIVGQECPPFPPANVDAWSLNGDADVAGDVNCLFSPDQSFVWHGGPLVPLPMPAGATESRACQFGDDGHIVGYVSIQDDGLGRLGFVYDGAQTVVLGVLDGHTSSEANARNGSDQIAGWSGNTVKGPSPLAVVWEDREIVNLTAMLGTPRSLANDINEAGQIVGWRGTSEHTDGRAFILDLANGEVTDVGVMPDGITGQAKAINDCGDVVARGYLKQNGPVRSFFWSEGQSTDLGVLPEKTECVAWDLNNFGVVVGHCSDSGQSSVAFIWKDGKLTDINDLLVDGVGVDIRAAVAINDAGEILGRGTIGGSTVAIVLVPVGLRPADIDRDCRVDFTDLLLLLSTWGPCEDCPADVNEDGVVNFADLLVLLGTWG